jgi:hypothetical protein
MNRSLVTGSSITASALFLLALLRSSGPAPLSVAPASSGPIQSARSIGSVKEKQPTRTGQKKIPAEGPWKASQARFAGWQESAVWQESECPASFPEKTTSSKDIANLGNVVLRLEKKSSRKAGSDQNNLRANLWCIPKGESVRVAIATVPDPVQTNMQLDFDRTIDGIQLAAESAGYVIDRYWLPWPLAPSIEYADYFSRKAALRDEQEKQKQPGLLLFRWNREPRQGKPDALFVFLVSDTPTTGVNGRQFENALDYIGDVCGPATNCAKNPITIIGPSFSGSLASLRHLTKHRLKDFCAYSGTVSSSSAASAQSLPTKEEMRKADWCSANSHAAHRDVAPDHNLQFISFMHDTEDALVSFTRWLQNIRGTASNHKDTPDAKLKDETGPKTEDQHCDIAIFSEAGTTYGLVGQSLKTMDNKDNQPRASDGSCRVVFTYPREISSLRNAYPGQEPAGASIAASPKSGFSYLPFTLADRGSNRRDEPPDFSRVQGPLSKEALLMSYAAELRRQPIRYAVIIGSNVLDVLFLTNFLRKACPDVRLMVLNADLLFERDFDNAPYIGTLTLTTYPLIFRNLDWLQESDNRKEIQSPKSRLPFVDQAQEGEYNAASFAISRLLDPAAPPDLREVQPPFEPPKPFEPGFSPLPLWVTAVGNGGHWPVSLLPAESHATKADPNLKPEDFSLAWMALGAMVCIVSVFHILALLTNLRPEIRVNIFVLSCADIDRHFLFINMASATLVAALGMMVVPILRFSTIGTDLLDPQSLKILMLVLGGVILGLCVLLGILQWLPAVIRRPSWRTAGLGMLILAVWSAALLAIVIWWNLNGDDPYLYGFFFAYRSVHPATGVSPLTPIVPLLAGIYCWVLFESLRLKFDDVRPKLRPANALRTMDLPGGPTENRVARSVSDFLLQNKYRFWLWLVFIVWIIFLHPLHPFQIFEKSSYGALYACAFAFGVFLMLSSGFRLGQIWSDLKKLLAELDQSPITPAFKRVRDQSWSPIWDSAVHERVWTNIDRCMEIMEYVAVKEPKLPNEVDMEVQQLTASVNHELETNEEKRSEKPPSKEIQAGLQRLLQWAMRVLSAHWSTDRVLNAGENDEDSQDKKIVLYMAPKEVDARAEQINHLEEFVALRYVAFVGGVLYQIRLLSIIVAMLFTLVLLSLNIYSFEPHQSLIWSFTAMFAVIGFVTVNVLREVHRDNVLSRITGSTANDLGLDFYVRIAAFGAAPLATLLATHFPAIGQYVVSFLQPGLEAVK